jgi:hypothetical protein
VITGDGNPMTKFLTGEEVEKLLAKKRRTPEEKEQLKYRKNLVKIEKQGKVAFVARQAIVEGLLFTSMGIVIILGLTAGPILEGEELGPEEMPALILMCGGWAFFVLIRVVCKMIHAIKLILGDYKMYEQYIKTGEINEELAVSNAERLLKKAGHGIAVSFGAIIITVGAFFFGIVWIFSGIYGVFISDKEYVFPVSILYMLFMYGILLLGIVSFGWGCYMIYALVLDARKYLSRENRRKEGSPIIHDGLKVRPADVNEDKPDKASEVYSKGCGKSLPKAQTTLSNSSKEDEVFRICPECATGGFTPTQNGKCPNCGHVLA